ncbi:MAG: ABC transporter permease [Ignavibacteria bacterium]|nr:ABC transporter permease [Ignavibacteria bacterium]
MSFTSLVARRFFRSRQDDRFVSLISLISILGIMLGTTALIITLSVLGGFEREITGKVIGFTSHIQIQGFQNLPLEDPERSLRILQEQIPEIVAVAPSVSREGIIRSKEGVDGILLKGIPPEGKIQKTRRYLVEGTHRLDREPDETPRLMIGKKLARRLALAIGDKAALFILASPDGSWQPMVKQFRVTGIYESGMSEYDDVMAFTALEDAQEFLRLGNTVTGYDVMIRDLDSAAVVAGKIEEELGYPHYARTVFESYRNYFSWIKLQTELDPVIVGLIIPVAAVNIIGTLLMMVLGKTREVGVLLALGSSRGAIARIFLRQGLLIAFLGTLLGNFLAFFLLFVQKEFSILSLPSDVYFMSSVPVLFRWEYFVIVSGLSILLSLICSVLPARLAARIEPVNAIRFS